MTRQPPSAPAIRTPAAINIKNSIMTAMTPPIASSIIG
jgi:hypothetical protein